MPLAVSLPAMLWNQMPVGARWSRSTSACTSMWASTQWGSTSCRPKVTSSSCRADSMAPTDSGVDDTGLQPSTTSPTA